MAIYIILFCIALLLSVLEITQTSIAAGKHKISVKKFNFTILYVAIMLVGVLRSELLGVDSWRYKYHYWNRYISQDLATVLKSNFDKGYALLNWIIGKFTVDYWLFRAIIFAISFSLIALWIFKHSEYVAISFFVFISFGYIAMEFYLLRLAIAVSIFIWSYDSLINRKPLRYILITLLASMFHQSALFGLLIYPMLMSSRKDFKTLIKVLYYIGTAAIILLGGAFLARLYSKNEYDVISRSGEGYGLLAFYVLLFIVIYYFKQRINKDDAVLVVQLDNLFDLAIICILVQLLATRLSIVTRMQKFISPYIFILIPGILELSDRNRRLIFGLIMIGLLGFLYFYANYRLGDIVPYISHFSD